MLAHFQRGAGQWEVLETLHFCCIVKRLEVARTKRSLFFAATVICVFVREAFSCYAFKNPSNADTILLTLQDLLTSTFLTV